MSDNKQIYTKSELLEDLEYWRKKKEHFEKTNNKAVSNGKKVWPSVVAVCNELKIGWNIFKQKRDMGEFFYV